MYPHNCLKCLLFYLFVETTFINCHHINDTYRLLADKLAHYDKTIRPKINQSEPIVVTCSFSIMSLQDLDEVNQRLSVIAILGLVWADDLMKWNPAEYGNMTGFQTDSGRFWTPKLLLVNNAAISRRTGDEGRPVRFSAYGFAYSYPVDIFSVSCEMDVTFYPWDRHLCILTFTPQGYPSSEMRIESITTKVDITYYDANGAWEFVNSSILSVTTSSYSSVNVILIFERKPRFAIFNVILPIIFMSFLNIVVFLIPPGSGERISYTITMLLAIAVFLTLVGDNLPKTSNPMPVFSYYLFSMLATSICITLATIFNLRLYYADDSESMCGCLTKLATRCCKKKKSRHTTFSEDLHIKKLNSVYIPDEGTKTGGNVGINLQASKLTDISRQCNQGQLQNITPAVHSNDANCRESCNENKITWKDISAVVDNIFLILFFIIFLVATVVYFVIVFSSKRLSINDIQGSIQKNAGK